MLACCNSDHESLDSFFVIDSFVDGLVDAVGAGDALLAYATLAMLSVRDPAHCDDSRRDGCGRANASATATFRSRPSDLRAKIDAIERQMNFGLSATDAGRRRRPRRSRA